MIYLPDSNTIIAPFWEGNLRSIGLGLGHSSLDQTRRWLIEWFSSRFESGRLVAAEELLDEVIDRKDDTASRLLKGLMEQGSITTIAPNNATFSYIREIEQFVRQHYQPYKAEPFLKGNDPIFIALAKTHNAALITIERHTVPVYDGRERRFKEDPRVPYVAWALGVKCITLYQAFVCS